MMRLSNILGVFFLVAASGAAGARDPVYVAAGDADANYAFLLAGPSGMCTASLLTREIIVTAAHCFDNGLENWSIYFGVDAADLVIRKGESRRAIDIRIHPQYSPAGGEGVVSPFDVALARLDRPVGEGAGVGMFSIGHSLGLLGDGTPTLANLGYGKVARKGVIESDIRLKAREVSFFWDSNQGRFSVTAGNEACKGDSGGPIFSRDNGGNRVVAVLSFGAVSCAARAAGSFLLVRASQWLARTVEELGGSLSDAAMPSDKKVRRCVQSSIESRANDSVVTFTSDCLYPANCAFSVTYRDDRGGLHFEEAIQARMSSGSSRRHVIPVASPDRITSSAQCVEIEP